MKKFVVIFLMSLVILIPLFADESFVEGVLGKDDEAVKTSWAIKGTQIVVGIFGTILVLMKNATAFVVALRDKKEDPDGVGKVVYKVLVQIAIIALIVICIKFLGGLIGGWLGQVFQGNAVQV